MTGVRRHDSGEGRTYAAAAAFVLGLTLIVYIAFFHPTIGATFDVHAVVRNGNQLRPGSPVRIAGVDIGQVAGVGRGPGQTATITLRIQKAGQPLHSDATLKIRPRLFLEGGYYVDLKSGSPSAPNLPSGGTIPLPQTAVPVQLNDVLSSLDSPARDSLKSIVRELHAAVSHGGARSLRRTAPNLWPVLRDLARVAKAARGTQPHDLSELIRSTAKVTGAVAERNQDLSSLVVSLDRTTRALTADDGALGRTVEALDRLTRAAPEPLAEIDATLPALARFSRAAEPGLRNAPANLRQISASLRELAAVVTPRERKRVLNALTITFRDLPTFINRLASLFPVTRPLTECLFTHVTPSLNAQVPDGPLSTGRPAWQDFAHTLVGLAGISQNFDANGFSIRYDAGFSPAGGSFEAVPGLGLVASTAPPPLGSRPTWLGRGVKPDFRPDAPCADQPLPNLAAQAPRPAAQGAAGSSRAPRITLAGLKRLLAEALR